MKKYILVLLSVLTLSILGCASNESRPSNTSEVNIGSQLRFTRITFDFNQKITPKVAYHSSAELETMVNNKITTLLNKKGILTSQSAANELKIKVSYFRRFVGDATKVPSSSLAYPELGYQIDIADNTGKIIKTLTRKNQTYKGGFAMNLKVMAGGLKDKKYENDFTNAVANSVVAAVEKMLR